MNLLKPIPDYDVGDLVIAKHGHLASYRNSFGIVIEKTKGVQRLNIYWLIFPTKFGLRREGPFWASDLKAL